MDFFSRKKPSVHNNCEDTIRSFYFLIILFFAFIILLYAHNITRDIYSGDIGDIVTAAYVFGVPHPPGYPLLTFLGFLFSKLPLPFPVVSKVALISIVASIAGLVFFFKYSLQSSKNLLIALLSTSVLAFSYYYWFFSEIPEVFALSNGLLILIFYFAIQFYRHKRVRDLYIAAFISGLSLTNQHAIIAAFPAVFLLVIPHIKVLFKPKKRFLFLVLSFLLGLMPYIYVPIAASFNPVINWNYEPTLTNFINLVLRREYELEPLVTPLSQRLAVLQIYFSTLVTNYSLLTILICLVGIGMMYRMQKWLAISLLAGFFLSGPLFIFTIVPVFLELDDLGVLERFYMHSFILFLFFLPYGLLAIREASLRFLPRKIYATLVLIPFLIVPGMMLYYNFQKTDLSKVTIGNNLARDILSEPSKNAIIFLAGDSSTFNSWYFQHVLGYRKDITIMSQAGGKHTFEKQMKRHSKAFIQSGNTVSGEKITTAQIADTKRPFFSAYPYPVAVENHVFLPRGMLSELIPSNNIPEKEEYLKTLNANLKTLSIPKRGSLLPSEQNLITPSISRVYSSAFVAIGNALIAYYDSPKDAAKYFEEAIAIDGRNSLAFAGLGVAQARIPKQCDKAQKNSEEAINIYPLYSPFYEMLYTVYKTCNVSKERQQALEKLYKMKFNSDINGKKK